MTQRTGTLDLELITDALRRRWQIWLIPVLILPALALTWRVMVGPRLKASAQVLVEESRRVNPVLKDLLAAQSTLNSRLPEISSLVRSRDTVRGVLTRLGDIKPGASDEQSLPQIDAFRRHIEVYGEGGGLVRISVVGRDFDRVYEGLRHLTQALVEEMGRPRRESLRVTVTFLEAELTRIKSELGEIEQELQQFTSRSANYLPEVRKLKLAKHEKLQNALLAARTALVETERARELAESRVQSYSPEKRKVANSLLAARRKLRALRSSYTAQHPQVRGAKQEVIGLERRLATMEGSVGQKDTTKTYGDIIASAEANKEKVDFLEEQLSKSMDELQSFAAYDKTLDNLTRKRQAKAEIYESLLKRYEDAVIGRALADREQATDIRIVEKPSRPTPTARDNLLFVALTSMIGGLLLGLTLVFLLEYLDPTVRTQSELEALVGAPVLGSLPSPDAG